MLQSFGSRVNIVQNIIAYIFHFADMTTKFY